MHFLPVLREPRKVDIHLYLWLSKTSQQSMDVKFPLPLSVETKSLRSTRIGNRTKHYPYSWETRFWEELG